jgi:hypothetical protein
MAIPPLFIIPPARTKKGMASRAKLSSPVAMRWAKVVRAGMVSMDISMVRIPEIPILKAMGTPIISRIIKLRTRIRTSILFGIF